MSQQNFGGGMPSTGYENPFAELKRQTKLKKPAADPEPAPDLKPAAEPAKPAVKGEKEG